MQTKENEENCGQLPEFISDKKRGYFFIRNKFIELCRAASIISNDVRKILDAKLGIRNSAAHSSRITVGEHKAVEFGIDLINNVILKYV
jgi:hypothetical protein